MSIRPLSKELQAKAITELNEDPKRIQDDIDNIREWLKQQRHLNARMDDQLILTFLRGCKFSLEKTKNKFEYLYTMKTLIPEFFENRDPFLPEIQALLKQGVVLPLKPEGPDSPIILLLRHFQVDPTIHKLKDIYKVNTMITDILLFDDDQINICGMVCVMDTANISTSHLTHIDLSCVKKASAYYNGAFPQRPQAMHVFNPVPVFEAVYNCVKPFMNEKLQKRVMFHKASDDQQMFKYISKAILPTEYGGEAGPIQNMIDYWKSKVESRAEWFKEDEQYKSDESKRVGKPKTASDLFGIEGSFRKLDVD